MARKVEVVESMTDDIDGSKASETIGFALDGVSYEIDVNKTHARALRQDFANWAQYARKAKTRGARRGSRRGGSGKALSDSAQIRAWAASRGVDVNARGRIPAQIIEQYRAASRS